MIVAAEQAAPGWLAPVILLIPVSIMLFLFGRAFRLRARRRHGRNGEDMLAQLSVQAEGDDYEKGPATRLGLKSQISTSTNVLEPHVYWGTREGRQVFIRVGPDEKIEGGTTMFSNRHIRDITVLRVEAPWFEIESHRGELRGNAPELTDVLAAIPPDDGRWADVRVVGGPEGIVAHRSAILDTGWAWAYDLWLVEHLAETFAFPPLKAARIGPAWKVPYGLGRSRRIAP